MMTKHYISNQNKKQRKRQLLTALLTLNKLKKDLFLNTLSIKLTLKWWKVELNGRKWGAIDMLMGEYNHTIDAKGRLIVPAKFREVLGDEFVVTKGLDNCLFVYPNDEWQKFEEKLQTLPLTNKNARQFTRFFLAGAASVEVDKQGQNTSSISITRVCGFGKRCSFSGRCKQN